jgi:hypothetical protein
MTNQDFTDEQRRQMQTRMPGPDYGRTVREPIRRDRPEKPEPLDPNRPFEPYEIGALRAFLAKWGEPLHPPAEDDDGDGERG